VIKINAYYYDGQSSKQIPVVVIFHPSGEVEITAENLAIKTSIQHLSIAPRLANTRRNIFLTDGAKLETDENEAIDRISAYFDKNIFFTWVHKLEKNWSYALIALIVTIVFVWGGIEYGVPVAAKWAVKGVPYTVEQKIGQQALETLDKWLFFPSTLSMAKQQHLQNNFKNLVAITKGKQDYQLLLRSSKKMGANALALPGGIIILTDDLVKLAENDQQILAVLAHEMGHIKFQHGLRSLFQDSITALFMAGVLGDITSITSLSVALPTFLVESRYSREFELEADQYAIHYLQDQNIDVEQFSRILSLLEQSQNMGYEFDYLSSHPAMQKRINIILDHSQEYNSEE
jgi:Zn-dependent protease with chaperone function